MLLHTEDSSSSKKGQSDHLELMLKVCILILLPSCKARAQGKGRPSKHSSFFCCTRPGLNQTKETSCQKWQIK